MTRQTSTLRQAENTLFTDDIGGSGSVVFNIASGLFKKAAKAVYRQAVGDEFENSSLYRTGQIVAGFADQVQTRTEGGEDLGSVLVDFGKGYVSSKVDNTVRRVKGYVPQFVQNNIFENYVRGFLYGRTYGAEIVEDRIDTFLNEEYVENGKQRRGALGINRYESGRKVVRIPKAEDIGALIGSELSEKDARAVQKYIKGHEVLEANSVTGPRSDAEHAAFEARYLSSLRSLGEQGNERAREAYRGAMIVYRQRAVHNREFLDEVSQHDPKVME